MQTRNLREHPRLLAGVYQKPTVKSRLLMKTRCPPLKPEEGTGVDPLHLLLTHRSWSVPRGEQMNT